MPAPSRSPTDAGRAGPAGLTLQGVVERITYRAPDTGYVVLQLSPEEGGPAGSGPETGPGALWAGLSGRLTAVGTAEEVVEGQRVRLHGRWTQHKEYGRRFSFEALEVLPPLGRAGLVRYLSSATFKGVGEKLAERIVERLGTNALARIRSEPEVLAGIPGLSAKVAARLAATVREELGGQELFAFLFDAGLGPQQAALVTKKHGKEAEARLRANPYLLTRGITGIGFATADRVARNLGVAEDAPERRRAAILQALQDAAAEGHSLQREGQLARRLEDLLDRPTAEEELDLDLEALAASGEVVVESIAGGETPRPERAVYLAALHTCESRLAVNLRTLLGAGPVPPLAGTAELRAAERRSGLDLHGDQRAAVLGLLGEPLALLTGGPGVGKTTIVRLVVELAEGARRTVLLASPTGRAAKRLAEATGRPASTIHRLLGYEPATGGFAHGDRHPLEADLIVVDEISMLDVVLAHHLLKAIQPPTRLVLVGDPDQLPSVAAGNVLADLIASEAVPVFRLTRVFRQAERSLIVANAHRILAGREPELPGRDDPPADFYFFPAEGDAAAAARLLDVVTRRIPERFGFEWTSDVQVLSPMYRGPCGVDELNERLRDAAGFGGRELTWGGRTWRTGDRVIQTRNDYEREVFNGDMGRIERIASDGKSLTVRFPDRAVPYEREHFADLRPAFAITVHRAQGAEYPVVVLPLVPSHRLMLRRNLLYTAVTRARELVVLVGDRRALRWAVEDDRELERESGLAARLRRSDSEAPDS